MINCTLTLDQTLQSAQLKHQADKLGISLPCGTSGSGGFGIATLS